ncbi:hypothetical protein V5F77_28505, partial [Xanthobacter sp. DSM 24535]|uniref:hypothetical protein n=1 Tax=Roseixanthobacter psychrophilus TaxID=3119917 RepID=UPI00372C9283
IAPVLDPAQDALTAALGLGASLETAQAVAAALVDLPRPLADVAIGTPEAAIGAGPLVSAETVPTLTARSGADMLLGLADQARGLAAHGALAEAVRLSAQVALLGQAVRTAADIDYESRQDAMAWRARLDDALDRAADDLAEAQDAWAGERATLWSALADLRGALARDMHEIIGRLPPVLLFTPQATVSAWILAQHFAGDDPRDVVPMFDDIVRRNRLRHPGAIPAGTAIEVLLR